MERIEVFGAELKELNRDYVLDNAITKVVNTTNIGELSGKPHRLFADLAEMVGFPITVTSKDGEDMAGFATADYRLLEHIGVTEEELFEAARRNTANSVKFVPFSKLLTGHPLLGEDDMLYLVTNEDALYGAGAIAIPEILMECREKIGSDVYIIPSSVHEIILCKKDMFDESADIEGIVAVIGGVNTNFVEPNEILSGHLYGLDEDGKVFIAD